MYLLLNLLNFTKFLLNFCPSFSTLFHPKAVPCNHFPYIKAMQLSIPPDPVSWQFLKNPSQHELCLPWVFPQMQFLYTQASMDGYIWKPACRYWTLLTEIPLRTALVQMRRPDSAPVSSRENGDRYIVYHMLLNMLSILLVELKRHMHFARKPLPTWTSAVIQRTSMSDSMI